MNQPTLICPVNNEWVNTNQVRINASIVFIACCLALTIQTPYIILLLCIDFFCRGFIKKRVSLLNYLSKSIITAFDIPTSKENEAPKIFAVKVGFVFTVLSLICFFLGYKTSFNLFVTIIILFSFLEFAFKFCAGCVVFTLLVKFKIIKA